MIKKLHLTAIFVVLFSALTCTSVFAQDGKVYPGASCHRESGSTSFRYTQKGSMVNTSATQDLWVICPAVNERLEHPINDGWVKVVDRHETEGFMCAAYSQSRNASSGWSTQFSGWRYSSGANFNTQTLVFNGPFGFKNDVSHYYVLCNIPPTFNGAASYISSYRIDEQD